MSKTLKRLLIATAAGCIFLVAVQVVPYGRNHTNPPVIREPHWDSAETRVLAKRACFDCHSHETVWAWYSRIAPASWLVQYDVDKGRNELNFSDWQSGVREGEHPDKISKEVTEGEMPPLQYRFAHPEARLSETEKRRLIDGLKATAWRNN